jgi:hypothetical protein
MGFVSGAYFGSERTLTRCPHCLKYPPTSPDHSAVWMPALSQTMWMTLHCRNTRRMSSRCRKNRDEVRPFLAFTSVSSTRPVRQWTLPARYRFSLFSQRLDCSLLALPHVPRRGRGVVGIGKKND